MTDRLRRKNEKLLDWLRATSVAAATYAGLVGMHFAPAWGAAALALAAGGLTLAATDLGIITALFALSLPMTAANPVIGVTFLILGVIGIRYLGADGGQVFFVVAAALAGAFGGPAWAAVALAGFVMGAGEGALAAAIACVSIEALGIALGRASIGAVATGGSPERVLMAFSKVPENLFSAAWLREAFGGLGTESVNRVIDAVAASSGAVVLVAQPVAWALGAAAAGMIARSARSAGKPVVAFTGLAAGVAVPAIAYAVLGPISGAPVEVGRLALATGTSAVVALAIAWLLERAFAFELPATVGAPRNATVAAEDADVDELLRLIATAEEKLTAQHTTVKTVLITDMKSFARMTEEDGSMLTAKAIQKHRDLLLPIIERRGGHGKSTGGDGLVAAFDSPAEAVRAACEMQLALSRHNESHPGQREMTVRIGIADGEVILDKRGRPFIGAALNLAARVMNLADGGQAFVTATVATKGGASVRTHSHGRFDLKNIAEPIEILELLYEDGQRPIDPRERLTA